MMSEVTAVRSQPQPAPVEAPVLLRELEPWPRVFFRNLADTLLRREPPRIVTTAAPVPLRRDYFIKTGISPTPILESYGGHIVFVIAVYLICTLAILNRPSLLQSPVKNTTISYQPLSDYLPPINTMANARMAPRKGAPKLAKQEILSVPANPDNTHQTIVTPPKVQLQHDAALPNIVAWTPIPAAQPVAASARSVAKLTVPQFEPEVVAPTPDISHLQTSLRVSPVSQPTAVAPTADVSKLKDSLRLPALQPSVVEPAVSTSALKAGQLNMADLQPEVAAPKLPVAPQRATAAQGTGTTGSAKAAPAPPAPNVQNLGPDAKGQGQLIALGLNPADVRGPITAPEGNRTGEFHASPSGKADAPGTPNVVANGTATNGGGSANARGVPTGIIVGAPPPGATPSAVAGAGAPKPAGNPDLNARNRILADAMKPSLPAYHPTPSPQPPPSLPDLPDASFEQKVFGKRRYYSLVMNMPNLTSATGSWIIRFAELKQTDDKIPVTAPVAMTKVDPAYPPDVLRDHVEGTVTLYAVIRADGSVSDVHVLDSLDSRLDATAVRALSAWRFRPGTKNGAPIPLEAVVQIPFRMQHNLR